MLRRSQLLEAGSASLSLVGLGGGGGGLAREVMAYDPFGPAGARPAQAAPTTKEDPPEAAMAATARRDFYLVVLNDVVGWPRTLRLHKHTPNFEGMTWKEMVMMDEQALEAQGVAALVARRKILKTFEIVRRKMGINDPNALAPPQPRHRRRVVSHRLFPLDRIESYGSAQGGAALGI